MLSSFLILFCLLYVAAGFAIRIGWSKLTCDEQLAWKVAFFPHALLLGELKIPNGHPRTGLVFFLIFIAAVVMTCLEPQHNVPFGEQVFQTCFGLWVIGLLLLASHAMIQDWFK